MPINSTPRRYTHRHTLSLAHAIFANFSSHHYFCLFYWTNFEQGEVYAVDESTLFIKGFAYDGNGPAAYFWVGKTPRPSPEGYIIPYPEEYSGR